MSGKKAAYILLGLAAILVVLRFAVFSGGKDDAVLIREALAESIKASKEGRPGGVLDKLRERFKINDTAPGSRQVADFVRKNRPEVVVMKPDPVITGDTAQINSPVKLTFDFLNQHFDTTVDNVTIRFEREDSRQWLIFPSKQWRVTQVDVPEGAMPQLPSLGF